MSKIVFCSIVFVLVSTSLFAYEPIEDEYISHWGVTNQYLSETNRDLCTLVDNSSSQLELLTLLHEDLSVVRECTFLIFASVALSWGSLVFISFMQKKL